MLRRFWRHIWTRKSAIGVIIAILLLVIICAVIQVSEIWGKAWSNVASGGVIVLTAVTATIAFFGIPASSKQEGRREMQEAINQYVVLQSLEAKSNHKSIVINRMRELAPVARYSWEEIAHYLHSLNEGERFAALSSAQWQWQNDEVYAKTSFSRSKGPQEIPLPPKHPDKGYFPQLLERLCKSSDQFQNYHATVAIWGMSYSLEPEQMQELCDRVLNKNECPLVWTCDEYVWSQFIEYLKEKCKKPYE